jgi:hypothetical protein
MQSTRLFGASLIDIMTERFWKELLFMGVCLYNNSSLVMGSIGLVPLEVLDDVFLDFEQLLASPHLIFLVLHFISQKLIFLFKLEQNGFHPM